MGGSMLYMSQSFRCMLFAFMRAFISLSGWFDLIHVSSKFMQALSEIIRNHFPISFIEK